MRRLVVAVALSSAIVSGTAGAQTTAKCTTYNDANEPSSSFTGGDAIIVRGTGFGPKSTVLVSLQQSTRNIELGSASANDLGAFSLADTKVPDTVSSGKAQIRALDARGSATCSIVLAASKGKKDDDGLGALFIVWGFLLAAFGVFLGVLTYRRWKAERLREAFDRITWREQFEGRPVVAPSDEGAESASDEVLSHEEFLAQLAGDGYEQPSVPPPTRVTEDTTIFEPPRPAVVAEDRSDRWLEFVDGEPEPLPVEDVPPPPPSEPITPPVPSATIEDDWEQTAAVPIPLERIPVGPGDRPAEPPSLRPELRALIDELAADEWAHAPPRGSEAESVTEMATDVEPTAAPDEPVIREEPPREETVAPSVPDGSHPPRLPVGWDAGRLRARRKPSDAIERLRRDVREWRR